MSIKKLLTPLAVAACLAGANSSYGAIITQFSSQAAWEAAAGTPVAVEDFADTTLVPGLSVSPAGGGSISGGVLNDSLAVFGLCIEGGTGCPATTIFGFSPGTTAFGADWDLSPGGQGSGIFFSVTLQGGAKQTVSPGIVNPPTGTFSGFFGFVSDTPFTEIRLGSGFTGNGELFDADNVRFRVAAQNGTVPEPGTVALIALALLGFSGRLLRRRA